MFYYGSIWLKSGIAQQVLVEVSQTEFQQYLQNSLWYTWEIPFKTLCKLGFIVIVAAVVVISIIIIIIIM